jgi:S-(hydroxymethyl)glutathione dehydrogenase/alcohol dehydrogenase
MKAAIMFEPHKPLEIHDIKVRDPLAHEVVVRTAAAGLCHSDLHFMEGLYPTPMPIILGHESAGVVEAVGSEVEYVQPGDHVITCLSVFCGTCKNCTSGRTQLCLNTAVKQPPGQADRFVWDRPEKINQFANLSSYAEQMLVHENALVKVRKDMPLDRGALIGCGVITGFGAAVNTAKVRFNDSVAIIGCGGVGMAALHGAAIAGASRVIAVDTNPVKLQLAAKLGATDLVNPKRTAEQAFEMLAVGGTATIVGMVPFGQKLEIHGADFLREKKIQGSSMGSNQFRTDMTNLVELYMNGKLQLDDWISNHIKIEEINEGFTAMKEGRVVRSVIDFGVTKF